MRSKCGSLFLSIFLLLLFSSGVLAITWYPKEFTCPIDKQKNTFMVVGSYGSYIYQYPSKYQWLFFPNTSGNNFYMCKKCHLTTYMWDFDKLPKEKLPAIRNVLAKIKFDREFDMYNKVPVTERLVVMEKVYEALGKEELFWERFHRIKGYHYGKEGDSKRAEESRRKSLKYIDAELKKKKSKMPRKLLLYISGAMRHFLNDDKGAKEDLNRALSTKYLSDDASEEENTNAETGLNE